MRVQLGARRSQSGEDEGAVAIIVAILAVVLIGITAFTTDFGMAYVAKRQLQTASDGASLAAAAEYGLSPGSCTALANDGTLRTKAGSVGDTLREENLANSSRDDFAVTCTPDSRIEVTYGAADTSPRFFGGVFGSGDYELTRTATAMVEPASEVAGLRPWAVCNTDLPPRNPDGSYSTPPGVFKLDYTNESCESRPGNWWTVDCPEVTTPSNQILIDKTKNGCSDPISIVANQPEFDPQLHETLVAACASGKDEDCLSANPSRDFNPQIADAWDTLLGKTIILPVFRDGTLTKQGTNSLYPVHRLVAVRVCGYHWGNNANKYGPDIAPTSGPCQGANATTGTNQDLYLLVNYVRVVVSGSTTPSSCTGGIGSGCDDGVRQVRLVE